MKALLIPTDDEPRVVEQNGLDDLQAHVGGMIEMIPYSRREDVSVFINEEGKLTNPPLPVNANATLLMLDSLTSGDVIVGPCIVTGFDHRNGESLPVPEDFVAEQLKPIG